MPSKSRLGWLSQRKTSNPITIIVLEAAPYVRRPVYDLHNHAAGQIFNHFDGCTEDVLALLESAGALTDHACAQNKVAMLLCLCKFLYQSSTERPFALTQRSCSDLLEFSKKCGGSMVSISTLITLASN